MSDLPPPIPESTGQPEQSELPTAVQPIGEFGNSFEISEFKDASFLNGPFITLIVALIFSDLSFLVTTVLKIHALDNYYSGFSKVSIVDPNHQHARSELVTATAASGIVGIGCLFVSAAFKHLHALLDVPQLQEFYRTGTRQVELFG
jgi:hypothetical protein